MNNRDGNDVDHDNNDDEANINNEEHRGVQTMEDMENRRARVNVRGNTGIHFFMVRRSLNILLPKSNCQLLTYNFLERYTFPSSHYIAKSV